MAPDFLPKTHRQIYDCSTELPAGIHHLGTPAVEMCQQMRQTFRDLLLSEATNPIPAIDRSYQLAFLLGENDRLLSQYEREEGHARIAARYEGDTSIRQVADALLRDKQALKERLEREKEEERRRRNPPVATVPTSQAHVPDLPKLTRPNFRRIARSQQILGAAGKHAFKLFGISDGE